MKNNEYCFLKRIDIQLLNTILFRRFNKILVKPEEVTEKKADTTFVATASKNLEAYGYYFSKDLFEALVEGEEKHVVSVYTDITHRIEKVKGCLYRPFYINFPQQVMEASDLELFLNAMVHYWGAYLFDDPLVPDVDEIKRQSLMEEHPMTSIGLACVEDAKDLYVRLLSSKTAWSNQDENDVSVLCKLFRFPKIEEIPCKENLATLASFFSDQAGSLAYLYPYFKTVTDVLRYAVKLSDGDVSLAENPVFKKMHRKDRMLIKELLNRICAKDIGVAANDMYRFKEYWKRLAEKIHPNENGGFENLKTAYSLLYKKSGFKTTASSIEEGIKNRDWEKVSSVLSIRPGDFARRLDQLIRNFDPYTVLNLFLEVVEQVSTNVLLQVMNHFKNRDGLRVAMPKGSVTTATILPVQENDVEMECCCDAIIGICKQTLIKRFKKLPSLGKVYIDPCLMEYNVPFGMRSASSTGMKTLVRGTKTALEGRKYLRFFIWWKGGNIDIDLSASALDANFNKVADICFYNLREHWACHSGDIVSAPNGAAEYIDIDTKEALNRGIRYVLMSVISYRGIPYKDIEECCGGYMERDSQRTGKIHEIKTVKQCFRLTGDTTSNLVMAFDLIENKMVWMDISLKNRFAYCNTVGKSGAGIVNGIKALVCGKRPNLYDLLTIHAKARGEIVDRKEHADTVFDCEGIGTQHEKVSSEYL